MSPGWYRPRVRTHRHQSEPRGGGLHDEGTDPPLLPVPEKKRPPVVWKTTMSRPRCTRTPQIDAHTPPGWESKTEHSGVGEDRAGWDVGRETKSGEDSGEPSGLGTSSMDEGPWWKTGETAYDDTCRDRSVGDREESCVRKQSSRT